MLLARRTPRRAVRRRRARAARRPGSRSLGPASSSAEGRAALDRALALHGRGAYVLQAAIASLQTEDPVDWPEIAVLYEELARLTGSPVVELNRAVAVAEVDGAGGRRSAPRPAPTSTVPVPALHARRPAPPARPRRRGSHCLRARARARARRARAPLPPAAARRSQRGAVPSPSLRSSSRRHGTKGGTHGKEAPGIPRQPREPSHEALRRRVQPRGRATHPRLVDDPEPSPLDLTIAPSGNIIVSSESPYGSRNAKASLRETPPNRPSRPRIRTRPGGGLYEAARNAVGPDGHLYCVGENQVVAFDFSAGMYLGVVAQLPRLNGQALIILDSW